MTCLPTDLLILLLVMLVWALAMNVFQARRITRLSKDLIDAWKRR